MLAWLREKSNSLNQLGSIFRDNHFKDAHQDKLVLRDHQALKKQDAQPKELEDHQVLRKKDVQKEPVLRDRQVQKKLDARREESEDNQARRKKDVREELAPIGLQVHQAHNKPDVLQEESVDLQVHQAQKR